MVARNAAFHSHDPLRNHQSLRLHRATGPFHFLNPTNARFIHSGQETVSPETLTPLSSDAEPSKTESIDNDPNKRHSSPQPHEHHEASHEQRAEQIAFQWRSRDNRKGRHALVFQASDSASAPYLVPGRTDSIKATCRVIFAMFTQFPYWDVSWLVAVIFTLGSVVWVINAFFVWLPLAQPATEFTDEITVAGGWSGFVGATIFELGSVLLMVEAVNANRTGCFGWALEQVVGDLEGENTRIEAKPGSCEHHHVNRKNFVGKGPAESASSKPTTEENTAKRSSSDPATPQPSLDNNVASSDRRTWQWYPSWHDLKRHYLFELGFLACSFQMFGATVFWISGFTAIPQIQAMLPNQAALNEGFWVPQIVGGTGFIISSTCFMLETQRAWYIPAPRVLGWHIGLWNLVGAFGFTLCGALGPAYGNTGAQFEASLATFWGSWAFLIGSLVQWYESLDKHPVEEAIGDIEKAK